MNRKELSDVVTFGLGAVAIVSLVAFLVFFTYPHAIVATVSILAFASHGIRRVGDDSNERYKEMATLVEEAKAKYDDNQKRMGVLQNELAQVRMALTQSPGHWQ